MTNTMMRWELINGLIKEHGYTRYLEIGVDEGQTFNQILCNHKVGVDPSARVVVQYPLTSDLFFKINTSIFDIIFIDGAHYHDQVERDIQNSLSILAPGGSIILHDTNPQSEVAQLGRQQKDQLWNGDTWKAITKLIASHNEVLNIITLDTDQGLTIIRRGNSPCRFELPDKLTYAWLEKNRTEALNLLTIVSTEDP